MNRQDNLEFIQQLYCSLDPINIELAEQLVIGQHLESWDFYQTMLRQTRHNYQEGDISAWLRQQNRHWHLVLDNPQDELLKALPSSPTSLYINGKTYSHFPNWIKNSKKLERLVLDGIDKQFKRLPAFYVPNLKTLEIQFQQTGMLPYFVQTASRIASLKIQSPKYCFINTPLRIFKNLRNVQYNIQNQYFIQKNPQFTPPFPSAFFPLPHIDTLGLWGCFRETCFPESLGDSSELRFLDIHETSLVDFPKSVAALHKLVDVNFSDCPKMLRVPKNVQLIPNLESLNLRYCPNLQLKKVDFKALTHLKKIDIHIGTENDYIESPLPPLADYKGYRRGYAKYYQKLVDTQQKMQEEVQIWLPKTQVRLAYKGIYNPL